MTAESTPKSHVRVPYWKVPECHHGMRLRSGNPTNNAALTAQSGRDQGHPDSGSSSGPEPVPPRPYNGT